MAVITFLSVAGAPGTTTSAVATAMQWPRPALFIEADIAKTSSILPGFFRAQYPHNRGLSTLSLEHLRGELNPRGILESAFRAGDRYFVAGFDSAAAGAGTTSLWGALAGTLSAFEGANTDVLIDLGRYGVNDVRAPLLQAADSVQVTLRPTLPDIYAARDRVTDLRSRLQPVGHVDHLELWLIDDVGEQYAQAEVSNLLGLPISARIDHDPAAAAVFSRGSNAPSKFDRSRFQRGIKAGIDTISQNIQQRQERLGVRPSETEEATA
ncbi:hypothetical protein NY551_18755 [Curtobacterium flaccumfaciens pv. oortii]|uniref:hypothetical protein n=1 Tax=Curtobacterium flaccumfaciens TaxID=2035 RepID=UPI002658ECBB|nr:hypothetical protein [Curtobacterium flaccumfaciens]MCS5524780.1 hypothetical protein [Curtobacterium flaccumfaciens pv. oortii]